MVRTCSVLRDSTQQETLTATVVKTRGQTHLPSVYRSKCGINETFFQRVRLSIQIYVILLTCLSLDYERKPVVAYM